ncbi:MAG: hypothetical protein IB616_02960 [Methanosarcinales archaeon]|nr:MAG: hypothetical protein IB616_02960 [Methanosarcinales archaeon]
MAVKGVVVGRAEKVIRGQNDAILVAAVIIVILGWLILGSLQVVYPQCYLASHLRVTEIAGLPDMDPTAIRIMPKVVAERYAMDALQYPRFTLGTMDISFINKTPYWVSPLIPDGAINFFILKDKGAVYVAMDTSTKNTHIVEQDMQIGLGMGISDWYKWKLYKQGYWVDYEDPYFVSTDQGLYIAIPMVSYEYHWRFPTLFTVPKWAGVALIDSNGEIEFLTPQQALEHPVLEDQKLYPERLTRYYVNSFRYTHGIANKLLYHHEELEIAEIPGQQNEQPFLVVTKQGMKWFIGCEPFGGAHGIYRIYLLDARTGDIQLNECPKAETLVGPVKACDYVRKANPIVDWSRMMPAEPIPMVSQGKLYWEVRVIPNDGSGIAYTTMVDSITTDVVKLETDSAIRQFVEGQYAIQPEIKPGVNVTAVVIIYQNGQEKQRIELFENESVSIIPQLT